MCGHDLCLPVDARSRRLCPVLLAGQGRLDREQVEETPTNAETHPDEDGDIFPREYVEKLRAEAAEHRTARKAAEARSDAATGRVRALAVANAARDVLIDPTDLAWTDDMADDDGWPDPAKITAAAEALVESKPHLGRPRGDVGQGFRAEGQPVSLIEALRGV